MTQKHTLTDRTGTATASTASRDTSWFPGRLIGGIALLAAPLAWFAGLLLRHLVLHSGTFSSAQLEEFDTQPFAAMGQLAAYRENQALVTAGYAVFAAGAILLWPAVASLARIVAVRSPRLARCGGTLLVIGLMARLYYAGVDQTAFQLTRAMGLQEATSTVLTSYTDIAYGPWRIPVIAATVQYLGALLLAVGAFRAGVFGAGRGLLFLWAGVMWMGALKESLLVDVIAAGALCLVLVPLGVRVLRHRVPELGAQPAPRTSHLRTRLMSW